MEKQSSGRIRLALVVTEDLLDTVIRKYHYKEEDREELRQTADRLTEALKDSAAFWCRGYGGDVPFYTEAVLSLGAEADRLQERYMQDGNLTECYMTEVLSNELLLDAYRQFNEWIARQSRFHVARFRFFGGEEGLPLEGMREVLNRSQQSLVRCNDAMCLIPKKSVVFLAELTEDDRVRCAGICEGCGRRGCPNRADAAEEGNSWPDLTRHAMPWGYERILRPADGGRK